MSNEKEIKELIDNDFYIQTKGCLILDVKYIKQALEFYLKYKPLIEKLEQITPRTIDNLQVGDYVEFLHDTGNYRDYDEDEGLEDIKGFINQIDKDDEDEMDGIWIDEEKYYLDEFHDEPKIIPHEALTILKDFLNKSGDQSV